MLNIDQCLGAFRPLTFVVAESDVEVLRYLSDKYNETINKKTNRKFYVYTTTNAFLVTLEEIMKKCFCIDSETSAQSTVDVLHHILTRRFDNKNRAFETYIFLDAQAYLTDPQVIRKIKDIMSRYQLDAGFTISLLFISQATYVPMQLERLGEVVFYDLPNEEALKSHSETITSRLELSEENAPSEEVINNLKGMTLFEVEQAYLQSHFIYNKIELGFIRDFKKSIIAKTDLLSLMETNITFDEIGGMDKLKKWAQKCCGGWTVEGKKFGLPLLKGLLMVGLPGCGKTLLMKALGNEWGLPVVSFDPSRIFSSRVGDSESNMRRVLQIVEGMAPCVLIIDEIEKGLAGMQSSTFSDSGVTARVIGSFLIWMQECTKPVFVVATANAIQYLPPELISRFDETFFVNLPQSAERKDIFKIHIKKLNRDPDKFNLEKLAENSKDLSGREIEQVLREAMYDAYHDHVDISTDIILNVMKKKTNLLTTMAENLKLLLKWVGWNEEKKDGIRARFASTPESLEMGRVKDEIDKIIQEVEKKEPFKD